MKTERRHELQTNWLADRVGEFLVAVRPYQKALVGVLLAGLVVWGAMLIMAHRSEAEEARSWNTLWDGLNGSREDLDSLADSNSKRPTSEWAQLILADNELASGVSLWFDEKAAARNSLNSALGRYQTVFTKSTDPLVREHALYGIGRTEESLCKVEDAEKAYEQLRQEFPDGPYSLRAKQRLDSLSRESTKTRYDWFASVEPPSNNGLGKEGDKNLPLLPPELEPFSQFTAPGKTPPPAPTPDKGATAPASSPSTKPPAAKTDTKTPDVKSPAATPDTKSSDTKIGEKTSSATPSAAPAANPATTNPASTNPASTNPDAKASDAKPADNKSPPPANTPPAPSNNKS